MPSNKLVRYIFTWVIAIAIFAIIFSKIELLRVFDTIRHADIFFLSVSLLISIIALILLAPARYRAILHFLGCPISFGETIILRLGYIPIKGTLPFKAGELSVVAYLKKVHNLSYARGVSSVVISYILNLLILSLVMGVGWFVYYLNQPQMILSIVILMIFILAIALLRKRINTFLLSKFLQENEFETERKGIFNKDSLPKTVIAILLYSLLFEGYNLLITFIFLKAFDIKIPFGAFLTFAPLTLIAASLPITPWGLGTRESAILLFFSDYASPERLIGGSLLISFVSSLFPVLFGLLFLKSFLNRLLMADKTIRVKSSAKTLI